MNETLATKITETDIRVNYDGMFLAGRILCSVARGLSMALDDEAAARVREELEAKGAALQLAAKMVQDAEIPEVMF
jgi:hypothetical protein